MLVIIGRQPIVHKALSDLDAVQREHTRAETTVQHT
jgi:hypothetical protein